MAIPNYFDADPSVALANAQQAKGINSLDAWLTAQQQLAGLNNHVLTQRLDRQQGLERQNILDSLAARGLVRSGDLGYQQGQSALNFNDKRYDLNAGTLQSLVNAMSGYLTKKGGIRDNTTSAYMNAFDRAGSNPTPGYVAPTAPYRNPTGASVPQPSIPHPNPHAAPTRSTFKPYQPTNPGWGGAQ